MKDSLETTLEILNRSIPQRKEGEGRAHIKKTYNMKEPTREYGYSQIYETIGEYLAKVEYMGYLLLKRDFLEGKYPKLETNTGDAILYMLIRRIYPRIERIFHDFANRNQSGFLINNREASHNLFETSKACERKIKDAKNKIKNKKILKKILYEEAEEFDSENKQEINRVASISEGDSPYNRGVLSNAADKWVLAGELQKAEEYYLRAGPYEYEGAAEMFEKVKSKERAIKFWTLAAKNPTGYSDQRDYSAGKIWEHLGNIPEAIKSFKKAIEIYIGQEGSFDLHGESYPGIAEAKILEDRVRELEKILKEGKTLRKNKRRESLERIFTFPIEI